MDQNAAPSLPASPALAARVELMLALARRAGASTLQHFQQPNLQVERKADASPVTRADREAETLIRQGLAAAFPQDGLLGEEFGVSPGTSGFTWVIDPIDGTISFAAGVPLYGVLLALEEERAGVRSVVAGICELPALGERVWAARGAGAWWERAGTPRVPARVSGCTQLSEALACNTGHEVFVRVGLGERAARLASHVRYVRGWSDCYALALVATGRCDLAFDASLHAWDAGPFPVILEEAGGVYTSWSGETGIRGGTALAGNAALHAQAQAVLGAAESVRA